MADETQRQTEPGRDPDDTRPRGENAGEEPGLLKEASAARVAVDPPELPVLFARATILLIAGAIAMGETNRLVTGALTAAGESRGVTDVVGMAAPRGTGAWNDWLDLPDTMRRSVAAWIFFHALFDVALYLGYFLLLRRLLDFSRSRSVSRSPSSAPKRILWFLLGLEIAETVLLWLGSALLAGDWVPDIYMVVLAGVATAKWVTGAVLVIVLVADRDVRATVRQGVVRVSRAIWEQRLSFVVVAIVGVLTLVPLPNIWDQLPDVERSWFDGDLDDALHPVWAMAAVAVVSVYLFVIGRLFSERVWTTWVGNTPAGPQPPQKSPNWWWWAIPPGLTLVTAMVLTVLPVDGLVDGQNVVWVVAVPLAILALSGLVCGYYRLHGWLRQRHQRQASPDGDPGWWQRRWRGLVWPWLEKERKLWQEKPGPEDRDRAMDTWEAGDVLAVSIVAMAGLGLIRSLIAPVLLGRLGGAMGTWMVRVVALLAGAALAGVAFPLAKVVLRKLDRDRQGSRLKQRLKRRLRPDDIWRPERSGPSRVIALALWLLAMVALIALMAWPLQLSQALGVVAVTLLGLVLWAAVLGLLMAQLQDQRPLPIFATLRLRATPVLTLLLVLPLLASQAGGDPDVHALSGPPGGAPAAIPNRPSLPEAFADWLDRSHACDRLIDATDGQTVRPMVLVAASGGGIRSAVWTARVMDRLRTGGDCASQAVFLSSGLSGGSVGLALSRGEDPTGDAEELAKPDALAAGIVGTLVGDIIAGSSGLRIPSMSLLDEEGNEPAGRERLDWRDRAALMEAAWEAKAASLTARFDERLSGPAGALVLNSTAAGRGCRVFVSQIKLGTGAQQTTGTAGDAQGTGSPGTATCQGQTGQPPASLDLQEIYGKCMPDMSWATAAMLSARFATLTPGARVPPLTRMLPPSTDGTGNPERVSCGGWPSLQLIDGGYAEGSGIGTLADIAPALLEIVRDHNATLSGAEPLVVPVVLYLEDETRSDIVRQPQGLSAELFVPLAGRSAKFVQTSSGTWLQRMAGSIADPCPTVDRQRCLAADDAVQGKLTGGIIIAAPLTKPSVEAPLGWTLSEDSLNRLEEDADDQATKCPPARPGGYPCLKQLLDVLEPERT